MTHGLPFITPAMVEGKVPGWSRDFDAWAWEAISAGDVDALAGFRQSAPGLPYAHPTVEHFTPLFVTLGAAGGDVDTTGGRATRSDCPSGRCKWPERGANVVRLRPRESEGRIVSPKNSG